MCRSNYVRAWRWIHKQPVMGNGFLYVHSYCTVGTKSATLIWFLQSCHQCSGTTTSSFLWCFYNALTVQRLHKAYIYHYYHDPTRQHIGSLPNLIFLIYIMFLFIKSVISLSWKIHCYCKESHTRPSLFMEWSRLEVKQALPLHSNLWFDISE